MPLEYQESYLRVQNDPSTRDARLSAPGTHGHADFPLEEGHEIACVVEAAGLRDGGDGSIGRREALLDLFESDAGDAFEDRLALELPEPLVGEAARDAQMLDDVRDAEGAQER